MARGHLSPPTQRTRVSDDRRDVSSERDAFRRSAGLFGQNNRGPKANKASSLGRRCWRAPKQMRNCELGAPKKSRRRPAQHGLK